MKMNGVRIGAAMAGLFPYQQEWVLREARFKVALWARQTGKDYTATLEVVMDALLRPGSTWLILAAGERQAVESLAKAREWARQLAGPPGSAGSGRGADLVRASATELVFGNGSRVKALPANPDTVRGYSANLLLTEFAFHERQEEIWRAIFPTLSNPLSGGPKKLRIISTPNGRAGKFAELWHSAEGYYRSRVTIHEAIAEGLPLDAAGLEAGLGDATAWAQEYLCEFLEGGSVFLPLELIRDCESGAASESLGGPPVEVLSREVGRGGGQFFAGIDFGRKHHLTVCWLLQRVGQELVTREVLRLPNMSTPEQVEALRPRLRHCQRVCLDYTGPGIGLGDLLAREFGRCVGRENDRGQMVLEGSGRVELVPFTPGVKGQIFPRLRAAFEHRQLRIPASEVIREDLQQLQQTVTASGQFQYRALAGPNGHCDRTTALALALRAAQGVPAPQPVDPRPVKRPRSWYPNEEPDHPSRRYAVVSSYGIG